MRADIPKSILAGCLWTVFEFCKLYMRTAESLLAGLSLWTIFKFSEPYGGNRASPGWLSCTILESYKLNRDNQAPHGGLFLDHLQVPRAMQGQGGSLADMVAAAFPGQASAKKRVRSLSWSGTSWSGISFSEAKADTKSPGWTSSGRAIPLATDA